MNLFVNDKQALLKQLHNHRDQIKKFGVKNLGLFGSFVKDTVNNESDIDLLIDFHEDKKTFDNFINLSFYLEEIFNRKVELVTPQSLSKYSGHRILNEVEYVAL
jgi:predicted nucleotidyltransferase